MNRRNKWGVKDFILILIGMLPAIAACAVYNRLPEQIAIHFNANNVPDGFAARFWAVIMFFLLGLLIPVGMKLTRSLDPKRENYEKFQRAYEAIRVTMTLFMSGIGFCVLLYNLGMPVNSSLVVTAGIGILFIVIGNYMGQIRFNYTFGVRTPWTLSNEEVWRKTHRLAAPLWVVCGFVLLAGALFAGSGSVSFFWVIGCAIAASVIPMVYSYLIYRKLTK